MIDLPQDRGFWIAAGFACYVLAGAFVVLVFCLWRRKDRGQDDDQ